MSSNSRKVALRTSLIYALVAAVWIAASDRVLVYVAEDPETIVRIATVKGWFFVLFTSLLVYGLIRKQLQRIEGEASARRQAEGTLDRYKLLADHARDIIFFIRYRDGQILEANVAATKAYGYSLDELRSLTIYDLRGREGHLLTDSQMGEADSEGIQFETDHCRKDGTTFPVEVSSRGTLIGNERVLLSVIRDITERKVTEAELRRSRDELELRVAERTAELAKAAENVKAERQRFLNVLETLPMILALFRPDHRVEWVNKAYREAFGDNVGPLCYTSHFGRDKPCEECQAFMPLKTGRPHNWEWKLPDGRIFDIYNFPFSDIDGSPMILEMDIDITEQRRAEEEKAGLEAHLRQAQKLEALGTLAGGIAHDFNNILAAIIGFSELVRDHLSPESRDRRHIERVLSAGMRGRDLVRQMLTFSRKGEEEKTPLRLSSLMRETTELLRASIPTTIKINVDVRNKSGVILGDPVQIQQVIMNLAMNAAYAMKEQGGTLDMELSDISVARSDGNGEGIEPGLYMKLAVRDTGEGISPEIMDKIFDPFFTTKKMGEGTGLGLSVVMGIVKKAHGHITVDSEPGKGSTFTVYFPKVQERPVAPEAGHDRLPTGAERILFVDDEEALVEMGEELLAELGYEVICRTSSKEALALFRADPARFDLVITDQTMPEMTGVEMAREMMAIRPGVPVLLATGFSVLVDADSAKAAGIKGFLMKPLTKGEIARTVRKMLDEKGDSAELG